MRGFDAVRSALRTIASKARQANGIYLGLSLVARVLNALGMFIAIQRFVPSSFGEMSYLTATAVSTVAFCSFGIELSINARLTKRSKESLPTGPTIRAGCFLAAAGVVLACVVICTLFAPQLKLSSSPRLAVLAVCIYSSFMIFTSLLTAMSFALHASVNVGISYMATSTIFLAFAIFSGNGATGVDLMFFLILAQLVATSFMAFDLYRKVSKRDVALAAPDLDAATDVASTGGEIRILLTYGVKQIFVVSAITFAQWLIQRKIVFGDGGASENAIYSIGNQVFNMMTFIPLIITPIIVTRFAAAGEDLALRRRICLGSLRLFAAIAAGACAAAFVGLHFGIPYLPPRYSVVAETGMIAAVAAAFQIVKSPFSLFFLSELKASREIASAAAGAIMMVVATSLVGQLHSNAGTLIRLLGCAVQALILGAIFLIETQGATHPPDPVKT
jgi:O-antigen/teichoic acid export membrane protein